MFVWKQWYCSFIPLKKKREWVHAESVLTRASTFAGVTFLLFGSAMKSIMKIKQRSCKVYMICDIFLEIIIVVFLKETNRNFNWKSYCA